MERVSNTTWTRSDHFDDDEEIDTHNLNPHPSGVIDVELDDMLKMLVDLNFDMQAAFDDDDDEPEACKQKLNHGTVKSMDKRKKSKS